MKSTASPSAPVALRRVGLALVALGAVLLVFMVTVEGEPGALPLGLLVLGAACLVVARMHARRSGAG